MNNEVAGRQGANRASSVSTTRPRSTTPTLTKAERRAAAKAARAAAARRRRRLRIAGWVGAATLVLVGAVYLVVAGNDEPTSPCGDAPFPPVPAGADAALCSKPTVAAGSGELTELKVETLVEGAGIAATAGQEITVNYVGVSFTSGAEFDASWEGGQPFTFELGAGGVIPGWDQGLVGVKVGSRVQLDIPSDLAYGDNPDGGRPAGPLRFVVDLLAAA